MSTHRRILVLALTAALAAQATPPRPAQVVAEATVLEQTRGDAAGAEALLRRHAATAAEAGDGAAHSEFIRALVDMLLRQGRAADAAEAVASLLPEGVPARGSAAPQDPVRNLVRILDLGAYSDERVKTAYDQLRSLGALAVPALLAEFEALGAFGRLNALGLLFDNLTPVVRDALLARVRAGDLDTARYLANSLGSLGDHAFAVAQVLAESDDEALLAIVFAGVVEQWPTAELAATVARRLAVSTEVTIRRRVASVLPREPWARAAAAELAKDDDTGVRASATAAFVALLRPEEEATAVAALQSLTPAERRYALVRPEWLDVAALILPEMSREQGASVLRRMEWRSNPDVAVRTLAGFVARGELVKEASEQLERLAAEGFDMPAALDGTMIAAMQRRPELLGPAWFALLPDDAEARVLAHFEALPEVDRTAIARLAIQHRRPWHVLLARMAAATPAATWLLARDWTGAPPAAVAVLTELAREGTRETRDALLNALEASAAPPADVVFALVEDHDLSNRAFTLAERLDPRRRLACLSRLSPLPPIDDRAVERLLPHFTPADLELLLRLAEATEFLAGVDGGDRAMVRTLSALGGGDPRLVALATLPATADEREWGARRAVAESAAARIEADALAETLKLIPRLPSEVLYRLLPRARAVARPRDAEVVGRALAGFLEHGTWPVLDGGPEGSWLPALLAILVDLGDAAFPVLRAALASAPTWATTDVAAALLATADARGAEVAGELLASDRHALVQAALQAPIVATEAALRPHAIAAITRLARPAVDRDGQVLAALDPAAFLARLPRADRIAAGRALLESLDSETAGDAVLVSALEAAGDAKDIAGVPLLAKALHHRRQHVRHTVAHQLGRVLDRAAVPHLLTLLKDDDDGVAQAAKQQLDRLAAFEATARRFEAGSGR